MDAERPIPMVVWIYGVVLLGLTIVWPILRSSGTLPAARIAGGVIVNGLLFAGLVARFKWVWFVMLIGNILGILSGVGFLHTDAAFGIFELTGCLALLGLQLSTQMREWISPRPRSAVD